MDEPKYILDYLIQQQKEGTSINIPEDVAFTEDSIIQGRGDLLSRVIENMKKRLTTFQHEEIEPRTAIPIEVQIVEDLISTIRTETI